MFRRFAADTIVQLNTIRSWTSPPTTPEMGTGTLARLYMGAETLASLKVGAETLAAPESGAEAPCIT